MIRYVGGKSRYAKDIAYFIQTHRNKYHKYYLEPFVGGGNIVSNIRMPLIKYACDVHLDLIMMYTELSRGWLPPVDISEELYNELKYASSSALRGYVGFSASFGGKWFGGYARGANRNFAAESYRRLIKSVNNIRDVAFFHRSYDTLKINHTCLIYCDPPYAQTLGYNNDIFDTLKFWQMMREWSNTGATVLISEYEAPDDFDCVWSKDHFVRTHLHENNKFVKEKIFKWNG